MDYPPWTINKNMVYGLSTMDYFEIWVYNVV